MLRTARPEVLRLYLQRHSRLPVSLLTSSGLDIGKLGSPAQRFASLHEATDGPLRWRRLAKAQQRELRNVAWDEIVILHNRGLGYGPIARLAGAISRTTPVRVFYADGKERVFATAKAAWRQLTVDELFSRLVVAATYVVIPPAFLGLLGWYRLKAVFRR